MNCCANCFGNRGIRKVFANPDLKPTDHGTCPYCETENVDLIKPAALSDYFWTLIGIYEPDEEGKLLVEWLRADWAIFSHAKIDVFRAKDLLGEILGNGNIVQQKFVPSKLCTTETLVHWEEFRQELMHQNRFFPDAKLDLDRLRDLLDRLVLDLEEIPERWFRARLQEGSTCYKLDEMGPPPNTKASLGRANPPGIPYLYLGSACETAIAELRPHTSERATVAEFSLHKPLRIVDLRSPRTQILPFVLEETTEIALLRGDVGFLERLGDELTRPVLPQGAAIDYLPSQYLCEYVKKCGHDGVIYKSSVSEGMNLALFYPEKATGIEAKEYLVTNVSVVIEAA